MGATCFCGCGRSVKGIRLRAGNAVGQQMTDALGVLRGALDKGDAGDAETAALMAEEGTGHLVVLTRYLHGEMGRGDLDRDAMTGWLERARAMSRELVEQASGPPWEPGDRQTAALAQSGTRARGVITEVTHGTWGNEHRTDVEMAVLVRGPDGDLVLRRSFTTLVVKAPRVGDQVEVSYDPDDPGRFVFRAVVALPDDDRVGRLRELGDLLTEGLLTQEEFEAEKARLLGR